MTIQGQVGGPKYREQLVDIVRRARELEDRARNEHNILDATDPSYRHWISIERRYATVRGNAEHLLQPQGRQLGRMALSRLMRRLNLF